MIRNITAENFEKEVINSPKPIILDFFATWCEPCRLMSNEIETLSKENYDFKFGKINIDDQPTLTAKYGIKAVPTLLVFNKGRLINEAVGYKSKEDIIKLMSERK